MTHITEKYDSGIKWSKKGSRKSMRRNSDRYTMSSGTLLSGHIFGILIFHEIGRKDGTEWECSTQNQDGLTVSASATVNISPQKIQVGDYAYGHSTAITVPIGQEIG